jgi:hypothetical protein
MADFHRWAVPDTTFYGSLPSGYDYINNATAGTPALADGQLADPNNPNEDTYFVGWNEDAETKLANRPHRALAENCDYLDDALRAPIPVIKRYASSTGGGSVSSLALTGDVFTGVTAGDYKKIIVVTDDKGAAVYNNGSLVLASLDNGSGGDIRGTAGGFYTNPRAIFTPALPPNTSYVLYYGSKDTNINKNTDVDEVWVNTGKGKYIESDLFDVYRGSLNDTHQYFGLNEVYRRLTKVPGATVTSGAAMGINQDTPGDGATIVRDGQALEVVNVAVDYASTPKQYQDPYLALFRANSGSLFSSGDEDYSGYMGFVAITPRYDYGSGESSSAGLPSAGFLAAIPRSITSDTLDSKTTRTRINAGLTVTLNPDSGVGDDARVVQLATNDYFVNSNGYTAVRVGIDMLELSWPTGEKEVYIINQVNVTGTNPTRRAYLLTLGGSKPTFTGGSTATARWIQPVFSAGGSLNPPGVAPFNLQSFLLCPPTPLVQDPGSSHASSAGIPFISGWPVDEVAESVAYSVPALQVCGFDYDTGAKNRGIEFYANGDIEHYRGRHFGALSSPGLSYSLLTLGTASKQWDPEAHDSTPSTVMKGGYAEVTFTSAANWTLTFHSSYTPRIGDRLTLIIHNEGGGAVSITWPANFQFSEGDDIIPTDAGFIAKYECVYSNLNGSPAFLVTRTSYDLSP